MSYLFNLFYLLLLFLASPWLAYKVLTTGKYRRGMLRKFLGLAPVRRGDRPCAWFHGVSVGEVLLLRQIVAAFRARHSDWDCLVSTTTDTGFEVAHRCFPDLSVFYWPFDFTWAVKRAWRRIRPQLLVLAELELWPNALAVANRSGCRVAIVNGRMSPRSFAGYRRVRWLTRRMLSQVHLLAVQNSEYAGRLLDLGAPLERVHVTGSVKFDGVTADPSNARSRELARLAGLARHAGVKLPLADAKECGASGRWPVWIVGSTQAPEEEIALGIFKSLRQEFPELRLILVPRHKERFEEVAQLLLCSGIPFARRSTLHQPLLEPPPILLVDTLGELGAWWALADVAFVGGSLSPRGGQNMIEPAAYGVAVTFGPHTWNFRDTVEHLIASGGAVQVADAAELQTQTRRLLCSPLEREEMGRRARAFVLSQQGATERTLDLIDHEAVGGVNVSSVSSLPIWINATVSRQG